VIEELLGLPAHPLLVHAAVVFVPLLILVAVGYALIPRLRRYLAWAAVALAIIAPASALLAKLSGDAFRARMVREGTATPDFLPMIDEHRGFGTNLAWAAGALGLLVLILVAVTWRARASSGDGADVQQKPFTPVAIALIVGVLAAGAVSGYYVFKAGDSGARMVWTGL